METSEIRTEILNMVRERDWSQFHTPENLAKSISIEAGELLECYQWNPEPPLEDVQNELADVLTYAYLLAHRLQLDPNHIIHEKLKKTRIKYPVDEVRGQSTKYDRL